eukprot:TRINITY_DN1601_c0_g1_i3.p1 TRINITY_DN1601_c0_g1~~TRINITY_DN1601_c0_g1_i3.p1  ORF type:complete len:523 (-),score=75.63 TRINITY_DN1601_c0_g1_i3:41-1609(-)
MDTKTYGEPLLGAPPSPRHVRSPSGPAPSVVGQGQVQLLSVVDPASPAPHSPSLTHHYTPFVAYCFSVNYILGVGILGLPWGFVAAGWLLGPLLLVVVTIASFISVMFILDAMSRAQGICSVVEASKGPFKPTFHPSSPTSRYKLTDEKREMNELVGILLGGPAQRLYEATVCIYLVAALWSYTSVFASALASRIPVSFLNDGNTCDVYAAGAGSGCFELYLFYAVIFAVVVVPLTTLDLSEQKIVQVSLAIFRFVSVFLMVSTTLSALYHYPANSSASSSSSPYLAKNVAAFNWGGLGQLLPIAVYSQIFHHSIPGLSQPVKQKKRLGWIYFAVMMTTLALYSTLGVTLALYFGNDIEKACTLNWAHYTANQHPTPWWASAISYVVVLFPAADVISAFPLNGLTLGNNLLTSFTNPEQQQQRKYKVMYRLIAAVPPVILACLLKDLRTVLDYAGCTGILLAFVFPSLLQFASIKEAKRLFGEDHFFTPYSVSWMTLPSFIWASIVFSVVAFIGAILLVILS